MPDGNSQDHWFFSFFPPFSRVKKMLTFLGRVPPGPESFHSCSNSVNHFLCDQNQITGFGLQYFSFVDRCTLGSLLYCDISNCMTLLEISAVIILEKVDHLAFYSPELDTQFLYFWYTFPIQWPRSAPVTGSLAELVTGEDLFKTVQHMTHSSPSENAWNACWTMPYWCLK